MNLTQERATTVVDQGLLLHWHEKSPHAADAHPETTGWIIHMVEAVCGDTTVGHLRVEYVTRESSYAAAPDGLHFMAINRGWCLDFDDLTDLWIRAHIHAEVTPLSLRRLPSSPAPWQLERAHAPAPDVIENDLRELHALGERERRTWLRDHATPKTAFVRVDDGERSGTDWRRRGIAQSMYRLAAQELGTRGLVLMASSLQSPSAQALWAHFEGDPQMPTKRVKVPGSKSRELRLVLDYRNK